MTAPQFTLQVRSELVLSLNDGFLPDDAEQYIQTFNASIIDPNSGLDIGRIDFGYFRLMDAMADGADVDDMMQRASHASEDLHNHLMPNGVSGLAEIMDILLIEWIEIDPEWRGGAISRRAIERIQWAYGRAGTVMALKVQPINNTADNARKRLTAHYERMGFKGVGGGYMAIPAM